MGLDASQADSGQESTSADPSAGAAWWDGGYGAYGSGLPDWSERDLRANRLLFPQSLAPDGSSAEPNVWDSTPPAAPAAPLPPGTPVDPSGAPAQPSFVSPATGNEDLYEPTFTHIPRPLLTPGADLRPQDDDYSQVSFRVSSPDGAKNYAPDTFYPGARALAQSHPGDTYAGVRVGPDDIKAAQDYVDWFEHLPPNPHAGMDWNGYGFQARATGLDQDQRDFLDEDHRLQRKYWALPALAAAPFLAPGLPALAASPAIPALIDGSGTAGAWIASQAPWTVPLSLSLSAAATGAPTALPAASGLANEVENSQPELSALPEGLHPVQVNRQIGLAHQARATAMKADNFDDIAEEVAIRPHTENGPADYFVRVDGIGRHRVTGELHLYDAKAGNIASFTPNQRAGYDLIRQYGGTIIGKNGGQLYPKGTFVPPTEVDIVRPIDLLAKNQFHGFGLQMPPLEQTVNVLYGIGSGDGPRAAQEGDRRHDH